jgi:cell shape-determining protein MreD
MDTVSERHSQMTNLSRWIIWLSAGAALVYLVIEHRPHLFGWIPYFILLACPVMHFVMHRGHRHHHDGR